jgi:hypothetical protein
MDKIPEAVRTDAMGDAIAIEMAMAIAMAMATVVAVAESPKAPVLPE